MRSILFVAAIALTPFLFAVTGVSQDVPKTIRGGVVNGKAISLPKPVYPETARAAGVEGMVRVEVLIDISGNVISASAIKKENKEIEPPADISAAWEDLYASAEEAARSAKFSPTFLDGVPTNVSGIIAYNFKRGPSVVDGGVLNGKAVELPNPVYPPAAKAVRATGMVVVQVTVDESGNVIAARAGSGHPLLQSAAVDAARLARFTPTLLRGQAIKFSGVITYNFVLPKDPEK
jgi:TonB family protein